MVVDAAAADYECPQVIELTTQASECADLTPETAVDKPSSRAVVHEHVGHAEDTVELSAAEQATVVLRVKDANHTRAATLDADEKDEEARNNYEKDLNCRRCRTQYRTARPTAG